MASSHALFIARRTVAAKPNILTPATTAFFTTGPAAQSQVRLFFSSLFISSLPSYFENVFESNLRYAQSYKLPDMPYDYGALEPVIMFVLLDFGSVFFSPNKLTHEPRIEVARL